MGVLAAYLSQPTSDDQDESSQELIRDQPENSPSVHESDYGSSNSGLFAIASTVAEAARYLHPSLQELGVRSAIPSPPDAASALTTALELCQLLHKTREEVCSLHQQLEQARKGARDADKAAQQARTRIGAKQSESSALNIKLDQLGAWFRGETGRLGRERGELARRASQLEQQHTRAQHEMRRREVEFDKLQARLRGLLEQRWQEPSRALSCGDAGSMSSSAARGAPAAAAPGVRRASRADQDEVHRRIVEAYEAKTANLHSDNEALRRALADLQLEHEALQAHAAAAREQQQAQRRLWSDSSPVRIPGFSKAAACEDEQQQQRSPAPAASPSASWQSMKRKLQSLKPQWRAEAPPHSTGTLAAMAGQAEGAVEQALLAKLQQAGTIIQEQEQALEVAMEAIAVQRLAPRAQCGV